MKTVEELFEQYTINRDEGKDKIAIYLWGKELLDVLEKEIEFFKPDVNTLDKKKYIVDNCDKCLSVSIQNKSTLNSSAIISNLSFDEIKSVYKPTEKDLKSLNRNDLIEKFKTIKETKIMKVESLKG